MDIINLYSLQILSVIDKYQLNILKIVLTDFFFVSLHLVKIVMAVN